MTVWAAGFWADGFWSPDFWQTDPVATQERATRAVRVERSSRTVSYRVATRRVSARAVEARTIRYERRMVRTVAAAKQERTVKYPQTGRVVRSAPQPIRRVSSMGTARKVDDLDMDEGGIIEFDFTDDLGPATVTSVQVTVDLREGSDPTPATLLSGPAQIVPGAKMVTQKLEGQVQKCSYAVRCVATCSDQLPRTAVALIRVVRL